MKISIMQPYFFPYAGYFRLLSQSDLFVIFDCVQFPRRGWVHRNRYHSPNNKQQWFTLPLMKQERDIKISNLQFHPQVKTLWNKQLQKLSSNLNFSANPQLKEFLSDLAITPLMEITNSLDFCCKELKLSTPIVHSSELDIDHNLKGKDKIIAICQLFGADTYLNLPGGRSLYQNSDFRAAGIQLEFLSDYRGSFDSMLSRLSSGNINVLNEEFYCGHNQTCLAA